MIRPHGVAGQGVDPVTDSRARLSGTFGHLTVDGLMETMARARPQRLLLADAPDVAVWTERPGQRLAAGDLPRFAHRLSRQLLSLGLRRGDAILVMLPNHTDAAIVLLGIMAAGMVACPVSPVAEADEVRRKAESVAARAIVATTRYGDRQPALVAREAAASYLGLRFVCSVDADAPDGVASLTGWTDDEFANAMLQPPQPTDLALVTFDRRDDGEALPRGRTHAQLIADGLAISAVASLTSRSTLLATFAPVSAAGVAATVVAPLLSGATALLHGPFDAGLLAAQLAEAPDAILTMPAEVEQQVRCAALPWNGDAISVVRHARTLALPRGGMARTINLIAADEAALWAVPRLPETAQAKVPRRYAHPVSTALPRADAYIEASVSPKGGLALAGLGVAARLGEPPGRAEVAMTARGDGPDGLALGGADASGPEAEGFRRAEAA
jgi:non-ribosomal peptide synthetase component F